MTRTLHWLPPSLRGVLASARWVNQYFVQFEHCYLTTTFTKNCTKQYRLFLHLVLMVYYEYKGDLCGWIVGVLADLQRWATSGTPALRWRVQSENVQQGMSIDDVANTGISQFDTGELYWRHQSWQHAINLTSGARQSPSGPCQTRPIATCALSWLERPVASAGAFDRSAAGHQSKSTVQS